MTHEEYNRLSKIIFEACLSVHKEMGPGLLESVYEKCLMKEFEWRGVKAQNQVMLPLV